MLNQITGQELHEWIGMGMLILFVAHNLLNVKWYGGLFKGKYKQVRIIQTMVNACLLIAMLCLGFSGAVMSRHVFAEYLAMMGFWIFTSYYISKGIGRLSTLKTKRNAIDY